MIMVEEIAKRTGMSRASVRRVLNAQQDICVERLRNGEGVNMMGIGINRTKSKSGTGFNYRTFVGYKLRTAIGDNNIQEEE